MVWVRQFPYVLLQEFLAASCGHRRLRGRHGRRHLYLHRLVRLGLVRGWLHWCRTVSCAVICLVAILLVFLILIILVIIIFILLFIFVLILVFFLVFIVVLLRRRIWFVLFIQRLRRGLLCFVNLFSTRLNSFLDLFVPLEERCIARNGLVSGTCLILVHAFVDHDVLVLLEERFVLEVLESDA